MAGMTTSDMSGMAVEVVLRWGGDVVEVRRLCGEAALTIGKDDDDDLFVPLPTAVGASSTALASRQADGRYALHVLPGLTGTVRLGDDVAQAADLAGLSLPIGPELEAELCCGAFVIEVRSAPRFGVLALLPRFDAVWANTALGSLFSMTAMVALFSLLPPAAADGLAELLEGHPRFTVALRAPASPPSSGSFLDELRAPRRQTPSRPDRFEPAADAQRPARSDVERGADRVRDIEGTLADALRASLASQRQMRASIGDVHAYGPAEPRPGLRDAGGGADGDGPLATIRGVGQIHVGGNLGDSDMHLVARRERPGPRVIIDKALVCGSATDGCGLDKEIIRRVVREHVGQVRYCYERALQSHAGLRGKLTLRFAIDDRGRVSSAGAVDDGVGLDVGECIAAKARQWLFPAKPGRGLVVVSYPFSLDPR